MLLRRYQKEVADLKRQLVEAKRLLSAAGLTGTEGCSGEGLLSRVSFSGSIGALDGGLGTGKEAVATELLTERDARRRAEVECTMLRIKLTRLQVRLSHRRTCTWRLKINFLMSVVMQGIVRWRQLRYVE